MYMGNMTGVLKEAGTAYSSRASEYTPDFFVFGGVCVVHLLFFFVLYYYVSLRSEFRLVMYVTIFA